MEKELEAKLEKLVGQRSSIRLVHFYMVEDIRAFINAVRDGAGEGLRFATTYDFNGDPETEVLLVPVGHKNLSDQECALIHHYLRALHPGSGCDLAPNYYVFDNAYQALRKIEDDEIDHVTTDAINSTIVLLEDGQTYALFSSEVVPMEAPNEELYKWAQRNRLI